ncbi:ATP-binding response regulator [Marinospirillum alkaliphilum]|uniref:histidine kinase n=1 Tax=Marinospirillum alkaliphilum DSM 21637 TaxID=1122209 RepID=A0A1K1YGW0_9GAMM|nr:hybrid sensor histidine kinase/response regulator [Marinospirillum alkaliphilum]SFX60604.1 Signal transduction histidine kinase [Marinospirillum alkaliphilum DSM 21637]
MNAREQELQALKVENARLNKINQALIERVEAGSGLSSSPYASFEQAAALAEQVKARTAELTHLNEQLLQEISDRKRIEGWLLEAKQDAEQANLSKTRFLAAVSHDLLQPLNAARLFTSALEEQPLDTGLQHLVRSVSHSLADVEYLLSTLVDISKLDAGVIQPDLSVFTLRDLLDNLAAEYRQVARSERIEFCYVACSVPVQTDLHLLARILRNFLANAMRYTPPGGKVLLGCRRQSGVVVVQVLDTGPGIPEDKLGMIFQEFQRLEPNPANHRDQGLGLGLAIVDRMARMLKHPVSVRSCLQRGSMFSVTLPLAPEGQFPQLRTAVGTLPRLQLSGARIWVLDNDLSICEGMERLLHTWGCGVRTAQHAEGLDLLLSQERALPDVLVVDYHLSAGVSGLDLVQNLQQKTGVELPVLVITANHSHQLKAEVKQRGYQLLYKPVKPLRLRQLLVHLLKIASDR